MKCPSCGKALDLPLPRCPHCRLSLQKLDAQFGMVPAHSRFLSDRSGALTLPEISRLRDALRLFHKKFPQTLFSVFLIELPGGSSVAEFAFWMANRARFTSADNLRGENCNLLLVIDLAGKAACLTSGYGLEEHVPEAALQEALDLFAETERAQGLAAGIGACIQSLVRQLRQLASEAKHPEPEQVATGIEAW